ncbi:MAG: hypothetical protein OXF04_02840, partial [bacterium]|nr:hypothetical protein [bacterium]
ACRSRGWIRALSGSGSDAVSTTIGVALGLTFVTTAASASRAIDLLMGMVVVTALLSLPFSARIDTRLRHGPS